MPANATHAPEEPRSLWLIAAQSAASLQNVGSAIRRCGIVIGAMRMSAPLPADCAAERHQGAPSFISATNCITKLPIPKISREAKISASRSGMSVPYSTRCSRVQNASWLSSDGSPTPRFPACGFGRYFAGAPAVCVSRWCSVQAPQPSFASTLGSNTATVSSAESSPWSSSTASSVAVIDLVIEPTCQRSSTVTWMREPRRRSPPAAAPTSRPSVMTAATTPVSSVSCCNRATRASRCS